MAERLHIVQAEHSLELQMGFLMHMMRQGTRTLNLHPILRTSGLSSTLEHALSCIPCACNVN